MKTLAESCNNMNTFDEYIEEGKIWDKIKSWFSNFFEPDADTEYDRWGDEENWDDGKRVENYREYLNSHFDINKMKFTPVNVKNLPNIISPNGQTPDEQLKKGFWKFKKYLTTDNSKLKFYSYSYKDKKVKDIPVLFACKAEKNDAEENSLEIIQLQILPDYTEKLSLSQLMKLFSQEPKIRLYKVIKFAEKNDKDLYNKLINDCGFEKKPNSKGEKYCKLYLNK